MTRTHWRPAAFGMAVIVAVIAAGCGGTPRSTATAAHGGTTAHTSSLTAREKAVKFSECLRANGVGDFPDPNASGEFPSYGVSVTAARVQVSHGCSGRSVALLTMNLRRGDLRAFAGT